MHVVQEWYRQRLAHFVIPATQDQKRLVLWQIAQGVTGPAARRSTRLPDLDEVDTNDLAVRDVRLEVSQLALELTGLIFAAEHINSVLNLVRQPRELITFFIMDDCDTLGLSKRLIILLVLDAGPCEEVKVQVEHLTGERACLQHTAINEHGFLVNGSCVVLSLLWSDALRRNILQDFTNRLVD